MRAEPATRLLRGARGLGQVDHLLFVREMGGVRWGHFGVAGVLVGPRRITDAIGYPYQMPPYVDIWMPRSCPRCHAQPGESCRSTSGRRAARFHVERLPEDMRGGLITRNSKQRQRERARQAAEGRLPLDLALRARLEERQQAFRERVVA